MKRVGLSLIWLRRCFLSSHSFLTVFLLSIFELWLLFPIKFVKWYQLLPYSYSFSSIHLPWNRPTLLWNSLDIHLVHLVSHWYHLSSILRELPTLSTFVLVWVVCFDECPLKFTPSMCLSFYCTLGVFRGLLTDDGF